MALIGAVVLGAALTMGSADRDSAAGTASRNGSVGNAKASHLGTVTLGPSSGAGNGTISGDTNSVTAGETIAGSGGGTFTVSFPSTNPVIASCHNHAPDTATIVASGTSLIHNVSGTLYCSLAAHCKNWKNGKELTFPQGRLIACTDPVVILTTTKRSTVVKVLRGYALVSGHSGEKGAIFVSRNRQTIVPTGHDPSNTKPYTPTATDNQAAVVVTGLVTGPHTFQVTATNVGGSSSAPASYPWNVDPLTISWRSVPSDLTDQTSATIYFHANEPDVVFSCKLDAAEFTPCKGSVQYTLADGKHVIQIQAEDGAHDVTTVFIGPWTVSVPPGAPGGLTATAISNTEIDLSWSAPSGGVAPSSYNIYRGSSLVMNVPASPTSYRDTGLVANTTYSYEVTAVGADGEQSQQAKASATTMNLTS